VSPFGDLGLAVVLGSAGGLICQGIFGGMAV